jgi:hypothetical protein
VLVVRLTLPGRDHRDCLDPVRHHHHPPPAPGSRPRNTAPLQPESGTAAPGRPEPNSPTREDLVSLPWKHAAPPQRPALRASAGCNDLPAPLDPTSGRGSTSRSRIWRKPFGGSRTLVVGSNVVGQRWATTGGSSRRWTRRAFPSVCGLRALRDSCPRVIRRIEHRTACRNRAPESPSRATGVRHDRAFRVTRLGS